MSNNKHIKNMQLKTTKENVDQYRISKGKKPNQDNKGFNEHDKSKLLLSFQYLG